jgi:uncharacterized membrane protein YcaP (DUF421 family)
MSLTLAMIVAGQSLAIYLFLVVVLSRFGHSIMAGLSHVNYLVLALLGSAVETGLYCGSDSMTAGLVSAATLLFADQAISFIVNRWPKCRRLLCGGPIVLIHHGRMVHQHLRRAWLSEHDVLTAIRKRGISDIEDIRLAVLEPSGMIGVVPK